MKLIGSASNICETMALSDPRVLSLRQVAMVKTAVAVCNDPEIQDFVKVHGSSSFAFPSKEVKVFLKEMEIPPHHDWAWKEISFDEHSSNCRGFHFPLKKDHIDRWTTTDDILTFGKWEELVDKKITSLVLPLQLQSELIEVFRFVTAEIYTWITNHALILSSAAEIAHTNLHYFHWNWIGKIDPVETARSMLVNRRLPTEIHDIIAINYGFDDLIMNRNTDAVGIDQNVGRFGRAGKVWNAFTGESDFNYTAQRKFFTSATSYEKLQCLNSVMKSECMPYENLLFCLSQMNYDDREIIFKRYPFKFLMYFLDWPLQSEFLNVAKRLLPFFTDKDFREMLRVLLFDRIMLGRKDYNYFKLLKEFWALSPLPLKQFIERDRIYLSLLYTLNHPIYDDFPNEKLFEKKYSDTLFFSYGGIKYSLRRALTCFSNDWDRLMDKNFSFVYRFMNVIFYTGVGKRKHEHLENSE